MYSTKKNDFDSRHRNAISSITCNTTLTASFAQTNNTQSNNPENTTISSNNKKSTDYIPNIRSLLDQTISAYSANDTIKAKELATTAYLDNFEHIEQQIGENLTKQGEDLLLIKLHVHS